MITARRVTYAAAGVRGGPVSEGVDVSLYLLQVCKTQKKHLLARSCGWRSEAVPRVGLCPAPRLSSARDQWQLTDVVVLGPLCQQLSVVDPLSPRQDLLSSHEHVVGVGVFLGT